MADDRKPFGSWAPALTGRLFSATGSDFGLANQGRGALTADYAAALQPYFQNDSLAQTMTHWSQQPNPALPYLNAFARFAHGGLSEMMRWDSPLNALHGDAANTALGVVSPLKMERFSWPVRTSYGKTIDMPITVNPSRSAIQRELAQAPHGDVRLLRHPGGDLYMWPANEAMHVDIADNFDMPFRTRGELQNSSFLLNKKDVEAVGKFSDFDDLIAKLGAASQ